MRPLKLLWLISQDPKVIKKFKGLAEDVINLVDDLDRTDEGRPDAIVIDPDGFEVDENHAIINKLRSDEGNVPIIIFTQQGEREWVSALFEVDINGYLLKDISSSRLRAAFEELAEGGVPLSPAVAKEVVYMARKSIPKKKIDVVFKPNEVKILDMLSEGRTKREISKEFDISEHTIDNQIRRIYRKLDAKSLGGALGKAFRLGVIS